MARKNGNSGSNQKHGRAAPRSEALSLVIDPDAHRALDAHCGANPRNEVCGVLVGFTGEENGRRWTRIVAIPLIVGVFYAPLDPATRNFIATVMFVLFAATDWLDGFLARKLNQTSSFGAFLDPVADKFLVCASLLVLVHLNRADVFVGLIIIGREIAISALREWMAQIGASRSVAVHMIGKLKTVGQMVAIPFLLFDGVLFGMLDTRLWGTVLIWIAAVLTVLSMVYYMRKAIPEIRARVK